MLLEVVGWNKRGVSAAEKDYAWRNGL